MTKIVNDKEYTYSVPLFERIKRYYTEYVTEEQSKPNITKVYSSQITINTVNYLIKEKRATINKNAADIAEIQINKILKEICVRVYDREQHIVAAEQFNPNIIRTASLLLYYIVKIKPIKCFVTKTKFNTKNQKEERFCGWIEENAIFGLEVVENILKEHNIVDLGIDKHFQDNYRTTLIYTLNYKTISKAMLIQLFDYFDKNTTQGSNTMVQQAQNNNTATFKTQGPVNTKGQEISNDNIEKAMTDFRGQLKRDTSFIDRMNDAQLTEDDIV